MIDPNTFFDAIEKGGDAIDFINKQNLVPWGGDVCLVFYFISFCFLCILFDLLKK